MGRSKIIILLIFLFPICLLSAEDNSSKVLLLNSYHKGYAWSDEITQGVEETFKNQKVDLYVEYMDTKRVFSDSYLDLLENLYRDKYSDRDFDLIITSDNNAFDFYTRRGESLFGRLPHVFCGYNYLKPEDTALLDNATGINEEADIRGNIDLIMSLHEDTEKIVIIAENTISGKKVQEEVRRIQNSPEPGQPEIELVYDVNKEEIINQVRDRHEKTVILLTFFFVDSEGKTYTAEELTSLISRYTSVPLYGAWDFSFGYGIIGGSLVSGFNQGYKAGSMALQILDGIPVKAIPIEYDTPHRLKIDYRQLNRFGISPSSLPGDAEVYFRPTTFFSRNARVLWIVLAVLTLQSAVIVILFLVNRSRKIIQKDLLAQGNFLKLLIGHIPDRIYWKDRGLRYLGCNRAFSESTGLKEEDITGRTAASVLNGDESREEREEEDRKVLSSGVPLFEREEKRINEKRQEEYYLVSRIPIRDERGECIGILGIEEDVTSKRIYQREAEKTEKKLRTIIDTIPCHIFIKNREGRFLMANDCVSRFLGYESKTLEGRLIDRIPSIHGQTEKINKDDLYVLDTGKRLDNIQDRLVSATGDEHWFQTIKTTCPPDLFDEPAVLGIAMDITALKNTEKLVKNRERDLETTLNSIGDGFISTDTDGRIIQMNPAAETLTGWTLKEAYELPVSAVLPLYQLKDEKMVAVEPVQGILDGTAGQTFPADLIFRGRKKEELPLNITCSPKRDESQMNQGAVLVFRDMTEESRLYRQLDHAGKMDILGQLAGGITHDFNNMLGGILGSAQLIRPYLEDRPKGMDYLELIISTAGKAADLTRELLFFSRKSEKESTSFDLEKEIGNTLKLLERTLDRRITITTDFTGEECLMMGDPSQVQSAFMNLGINASHAMPAGGELTVETKKIELNQADCDGSLFDMKPGPFLCIAFRDTGSGIPAKYIDKIFEPFFTTKEEGKGTGLGLSAVFRTVQRHGGSVTVESRINEGTEFEICLPLISPEDLPVQNPSREESEAAGTGHILVVDDDLAMRITAKEILRGLGYQVTVREDGEDGLEFYRENTGSLDLVILDMIMPRMNGRDCFLAMKEINPEVKAILTSGFTSEEDLNTLMASGLAGFCRKPYTIAQLSRAVEEALQS